MLNLEAGLKSRFWNDQATLNLSVFRSEFDDFQNASFLGLNFLVRNAEKVVSQGIELDGSVRPLAGLTFDYAVTYLDAEYDEFTQGACYFGRTPTNAAERTCDLSGETLPNAPEWRTNLGVQYEHALASGTGFFRTDWTTPPSRTPTRASTRVQSRTPTTCGRRAWAGATSATA